LLELLPKQCISVPSRVLSSAQSKMMIMTWLVLVLYRHMGTDRSMIPTHLYIVEYILIAVSVHGSCPYAARL